jgi:hypothetical protein
MWSAPEHRPQRPATSRDLSPAIDRDALTPRPSEAVRCPRPECKGQAMFRYPMVWVCPCCPTRKR